jgi:hypothetical protein
MDYSVFVAFLSTAGRVPYPFWFSDPLQDVPVPRCTGTVNTDNSSTSHFVKKGFADRLHNKTDRLTD